MNADAPLDAFLRESSRPLDDPVRATGRLDGGISSETAIVSRAVQYDRTFRTPRPPGPSNRVPIASPRSVGLVRRSARTSPANRLSEFSESSFEGSWGADARNIHVRRPPFAGVERSDPACLVGLGDGGESGSPRSAPLHERRALGRCPSYGSDASDPTALRRSAHLRIVGLRSPHVPLRMTTTPRVAFHAKTSSGRG